MKYNKEKEMKNVEKKSDEKGMRGKGRYRYHKINGIERYRMLCWEVERGRGKVREVKTCRWRKERWRKGRKKRRKSVEEKN